MLPQPLLYLSSFFEQNRQEYYDLLDAARACGAWGKWVHFFLRVVVDQSHDTIARAKRLQDLQAEWRERLMTVSASARLLRLAERLLESPILTVSDAQELLGVSNRAARTNVEKLLKAGILRQVGETDYGRTYVAGEVLEALE